MSVGLVCSHCATLNDLGSTRCPVCGSPFALDGPSSTSPAAPPARAAPAPEVAMTMKDCPSCGNSVPVDDRFCGKCGARVSESAAAPASAQAAPNKTMFFAGVQMPGRAKLVLVKG